MSNSGEKRRNGNGNGDGHGRGSAEEKSYDATADFEAALNKPNKRSAEYILRLYVTGSTPRSLKAISNLKRLCEEYLHDHYTLQVIDIYKNPDAARDADIIAAPTLIKRLPAPLRRFVGDLSNEQKILIGLGIQ